VSTASEHPIGFEPREQLVSRIRFSGHLWGLHTFNTSKPIPNELKIVRGPFLYMFFENLISAYMSNRFVQKIQVLTQIGSNSEFIYTGLYGFTFDVYSHPSKR